MFLHRILSTLVNLYFTSQFNHMFHKRFKFISLEHTYLDDMNQDDIPKNYLVNLVTHDVGTRHTNLVMKLFFFSN